ASPYSMGPASQGTPTPMIMGYNMNMNGGDYNSSMSGSQPPYTDSSMGYDPMHQASRLLIKDEPVTGPQSLLYK
ncbi:hypothetical protein L9F63_012088, partial [Diploptera punctata]